MTDTAQPLPSEIEPVEQDSELTPQQRRRAAALTEARFVLATNGGLFGGQKLGEHFTVQDLLTVGDWILDGEPSEIPENRQEGTEVSPGPEYVTTFKPSALDDVEPHQGISVDDDTTALPAYPEDALPR